VLWLGGLSAGEVGVRACMCVCVCGGGGQLDPPPPPSPCRRFRRLPLSSLHVRQWCDSTRARCRLPAVLVGLPASAASFGDCGVRELQVEVPQLLLQLLTQLQEVHPSLEETNHWGAPDAPVTPLRATVRERCLERPPPV
jgi:hypothetical protein